MSIEKLIHFLVSGSYFEMVHYIRKMNTIRDQIKAFQREAGYLKYFWIAHGLKGRFEAVHNYDKEATNELVSYLSELGILPLVSTVKSNLLNTDERLLLKKAEQPCYKVQFLPSKKATLINHLDFGKHCRDLDIDLKIITWKKMLVNFEELSNQWKKLKDEALQHGHPLQISFKKEHYQISKWIQSFHPSMFIKFAGIKH
jgi:hypothetical protein